MRCIHTADWHLGNRMHAIDRSGEEAAFLGWLREEIVRQEADCLIVAGDIYDVANPPNEAKKAYCSFLASLIGTCCRNVIIVGGNHDSGSLLDTEKELFEALNIYVVGSLGDRKPEDLLFELQGRDGGVIGIAAAVPYARELELRAYLPGDAEDGTVSDAAYGELYRRLGEAAGKLRAGRKIPVIATGHLYAASLEGRPSGFEDTGADGTRSIDILGTLGLVSPSVFPPSFDYVALGHIHYSTMVAKNPKIRYSGSPFVLGFDEANLPRHILCVDCGEGFPETVVTKIPVPSFVQYRRLAGSILQIRKELEAIAARGGSEDGRPLYLELYYSCEAGDPGSVALEEAVDRLPASVRVVSWKRRDARVAVSRGGGLDEEELRSLSDEDIFTSLLLSSSRCPPAEDEEA
ncbi:MAG: exonuclease subunit SbcD, partial [Treponema sp.]|nr:exonuclease subunit SbcD [Treponema sp.]